MVQEFGEALPPHPGLRSSDPGGGHLGCPYTTDERGGNQPCPLMTEWLENHNNYKEPHRAAVITTPMRDFLGVTASLAKV